MKVHHSTNREVRRWPAPDPLLFSANDALSSAHDAVGRPGAQRRSLTLSWRQALTASLGWMVFSLPLQAQTPQRADPSANGRVTFAESTKEIIPGMSQLTSPGKPSA